ncbi:hypothetical protein BR93DRAFT_740978 [Coniochaeta sp. PMI_546]|nr:hypothetical protein BR93DRAFT_740978 [Coniochaeta sp. PMI_546]
MQSKESADGIVRSTSFSVVPSSSSPDFAIREITWLGLPKLVVVFQFFFFFLSTLVRLLLVYKQVMKPENTVMLGHCCSPARQTHRVKEWKRWDIYLDITRLPTPTQTDCSSGSTASHRPGMKIDHSGANVTAKAWPPCARLPFQAQRKAMHP